MGNMLDYPVQGNFSLAKQNSFKNARKTRENIDKKY